jgi:O-antigen ligase
MISKLFDINNTILILTVLLPIGMLIGTAVSEIIIISISFIFLIYIFKKKKDIIIDKYFYFLILIWLSLILNYLLSINQELSLLRSFGFFKYIIFIFAMKYLFSKNKNINFFFLFLIFIVLITIFDIHYENYYKKNILGFISIDEKRIASFLREELKISYFLLGFGLISIGYYFEKIKNKKSLNLFIIGYFSILIMLSAIWLTGEKANSLRALTCFFLFFLFSKNNFKLKKIISIVIIILPILIYFFSDRIKDRFDSYLFPEPGNTSLLGTFQKSHHGAHYYTAFKIFLDYPFFGVGNKNFREQCSNVKYYNKSYERISQRCSTHPHQIYLELLSEHGLIGTTIILFAIFYSIFKSYINYKKNNNLIQLCAILFLICNFLPVLPNGSFFTSFNASIFWFNYSLMLLYNKN